MIIWKVPWHHKFKNMVKIINGLEKLFTACLKYIWVSNNFLVTAYHKVGWLGCFMQQHLAKEHIAQI